ncbi:cyclase family protein [Nakamurella endophytica]|uniref:Cyclase n=1 Tax=Nakamurella endophytica TaxID=1748367 RepID=A0A917STI6_9ACTN|nr:cyclase family protein [Nakamurella endophytica]GGL94834.1 cyclase [Nakamurella endophytica]
MTRDGTGGNPSVGSTAEREDVRALPRYLDLPAGPAGGRQAWHLFGDDDDLGLLNLLTPEVVVAAARLVRRGAVFPLNAPVDLFGPGPFLPRGAPRRHVRTLRTAAVTGLDDVLDNFYPQASSQWDSLAHISADQERFYNGVTRDEIDRGRNTVDHWARRGIVGRGVLLDLAVGAGDDPGSAHAFTVTDLERAREAAGITLRTGDILVLHTGFAAWYARQTPERRARIPHDLAAPGLEHSEAVCAYLWDAHVAAVASDTLAVEVMPADHSAAAAPFGFLHQTLIGCFGMALGELWWLADLVADCHQDGVHEFLLASAPAHIPGGVASPANVLAVK